jgi:hypothetical protein
LNGRKSPKSMLRYEKELKAYEERERDREEERKKINERV